MNCPFCNSGNVTKKGWRRLINAWKQRYYCNDCGKRFTPQTEEPKVEKEAHYGPRILILDIETAPMVVYAFQLKTDYISAEQVIVPTVMLCWAAKWLGDEHTMSDVVTSKEALHHDDRRISISIHKLLCEADLVVAFNGDRFDFQKLNYRFIVNGLTPPSAYRTIDPIRSLRNQFGFDSNKLDFVNGQLGIERKIKTDFQLWVDCCNGDVDALNTMLEYNKNDVAILEKHYLRIRPWLKASVHPNMGVYFESEKTICRICGGTDVREVLDKYAYTNLGKYSLFRCNECGAESTGRTSELSKEKRRSLIK